MFAVHHPQQLWTHLARRRAHDIEACGQVRGAARVGDQFQRTDDERNTVQRVARNAIGAFDDVFQIGIRRGGQ